MNNNKKEDSFVRLKEFAWAVIGVLMLAMVATDHTVRQDAMFYMYVVWEILTEHVFTFIVAALPYVFGAAVFFWIVSVNNKLDKIIRQTKKGGKHERCSN